MKYPERTGNKAIATLQQLNGHARRQAPQTRINRPLEKGELRRPLHQRDIRAQDVEQACDGEDGRQWHPDEQQGADPDRQEDDTTHTETSRQGRHEGDQGQPGELRGREPGRDRRRTRPEAQREPERQELHREPQAGHL